MTEYNKYCKFPRLKKFIELGGEHTQEGEIYLRMNPVIYNEATQWDYLSQIRKSIGDNETIHKINYDIQRKISPPLSVSPFG